MNNQFQSPVQPLPFGEIEKGFNSSPSGRLGGALYIHIPFCKQACHYCDFHFSTSMKKKDELVAMLCRELEMRKDEIEKVETIYFGGGTPSLLTAEELRKIFSTIHSHFDVAEDAEITLEANPDDLNEEKLVILRNSGINRLSIGVQSFFEEDLKMMNRAHNAREAMESLQLAKKYFENISIDLIYGIPEMSENRWRENIQIALDLEIPHFSCYALTVEDNTALKKLIQKGSIKPVDEDAAKEHFENLLQVLKEAGYIHYEFSNFGKTGYFSRNNTAYWLGKPYIGIGPSAHSYDGKSRKWNVSNNSLYIKALQNGKIPAEVEELSVTDKYNEYVMTRLRTMWGISFQQVQQRFGDPYLEYLLEQVQEALSKDLLIRDGDNLHISDKGKFLGDGIAADLFLVNLEDE